jgi:hypothetical protein
MQCFQFNKKHNTFLGTSNLGLQLQFKCFRIFNNVKQHNVPSRKVMVPKVPYRQLGLRCDRGRLPPPDVDCEHVRRFIIVLSLCETIAPMSTVYKQAGKVMKKFANKITIFHQSVHHDPVTCLGKFG